MKEFTGEVHPAAGLFPMMQPDEFRALCDDIAQHALREPLVLDEEGRLLDGRNRLAACEATRTRPFFRVHVGDPIAFVVSTNLHRRHLTTGQKSELALKIEEAYAVEAKQRQVDAGKDHGRGQQGKVVADLPQPNPDDAKSRTRAARQVGVSPRSVQKQKTLRKKAPDLADKVASGELPLDRAARIQRDREAEQARIEQAAKDAENTPDRATVDLRLGDFREVLADLHCAVDAIITDPPYPREFIPLLPDLAAFADRALTPDGVLVVLMGQTYLPDVYRLLGGGRPYRWTGCYLTPGPSYASHSARLHSNWKPFLVYGGGPRFADVVRAEGADAQAKALHQWGQDYGAFHTLVERFTRPGQTVCDPFTGSGTTLLAARALGRHSVGAETDPDHHATATRRLA